MGMGLPLGLTGMFWNWTVEMVVQHCELFNAKEFTL